MDMLAASKDLAPPHVAQFGQFSVDAQHADPYQLMCKLFGPRGP